MKITAISREHPDQRGIALITEPTLTAETFEEFKRRVEASDSTCVPVGFTIGHLIVEPEQFTPELRAAARHGFVFDPGTHQFTRAIRL